MNSCETIIIVALGLQFLSGTLNRYSDLNPFQIRIRKLRMITDRNQIFLCLTLYNRFVTDLHGLISFCHVKSQEIFTLFIVLF